MTSTTEHIEHGTVDTYLQHLRDNTTPCTTCTIAGIEYLRTAANTRQCGTDSGYNGHIVRGENPCDPCKAAHSDYAISRHIRRKGPKRTVVPTDVLVELYLSAPPELQEAAEKRIGDRKIRALVDWFDAQETVA